jgi:DNA primase
MARIAESEIERLKREISVQRLAEGRGVKLKRHGADLIGLCPFHDDHAPSLVITPSKNLWNCLGACRRGGTVIDWVMLAEGISFRHAVELLREDMPLGSGHTRPGVQRSTVPKLPAPVERTADDCMLLLQVVNYYQESLKQSPEALKYLGRRGLQSAEMIETFQLGFANRTIGYRLPASTRAAGAALRGRLQKLGIYRESGHEHFNGSVVIPICDLSGQVVQMYGRKITPNLREGTPDHLYLPGPHRGVWNEQALIASKDIILCEALIDALTFWCAGYRNVTTSYGVNGFTEEHRVAFQKHGTKRIYIAYDRDEAGEGAAQEHAAQLMEMGIECFRVQFPKGQDANQYTRITQPAGKALGLLLTSAAWLGKGQRPTVTVIEPVRTEPAKIEPPPEPQSEAQTPEPTTETPATILSEEQNEPTAKEENAIPLPASLPAPPIIEESERVFPLAAQPQSESSEETAPQEETVQRPMPFSAPTAPQIKIDSGEIVATIGPRTYRVLNLDKCTSPGRMQVNVKVSGTNVRGEWCYHGDSFDMESALRRATFIKQAAHELAAKEETIHREVGQLWTALADLQREWLRQALTPAVEETIMTAEEQAAALDLLRDPHLLDRILADFAQCGVVGEETNKKVAYLGAVSRLLHKPLAIVVQSSSSAGKSSLMEAVLDFMPEDQRESYTAMTGQSLFYMGAKNLKHKILAIAEQQGAERAAYPLKLLQSEGRIKIASTGKDPASGKHVTHDYEVEGPVMIFLTTTAQDVDEELLNRPIVLTVNEEQEQTRAIHQKQREAQTIEGMWAQDERAEIVKLHRNAQRLLRPLRVVNEHVEQQTFPDSMIRTRRDHQKFLTLVQAIALLYQHQRQIKTSTRRGKTLEYIEATADDVKLALQLVNEVLTPSLEELQPQTRRLLLLIDTMASAECARLKIERLDYRFTRATVRQYTRWGDTQLRVHLRRLEELEYLVVRHGAPGQTFVYQLNFEMDAEGRPVLAGLSQFCGYDPNRAVGNGDCAGGARPGSGGIAGGARGEESPAMTRGNGDFNRNRENHSTSGMEAGGGEHSIVVIPPVKPNGRAQAGGGAPSAGAMG